MHTRGVLESPHGSRADSDDAPPGAELPLNTAYPDATVRVEARDLTPGEYVVRVDAMRGQLLETNEFGLPIGLGELVVTSGEVRVHVEEAP